MNTLADEVRGVPLGRIRSLLERAGIEVKSEPAKLRFLANCGPAEIEVLEPVEDSLAEAPLKAVVVARTRLPDSVRADDPAVCAGMNRFAAFGALTPLGGKPFVVSRLTTYQGEDAWRLHAKLLVWVANFAADAIDAGGSPVYEAKGEDGGKPEPNWPSDDFAYLQSRLDGHFFASAGDEGFTLEATLRGGAGTAAIGDRSMALVDMGCREVHPILGPGLHVLLQLPHQFESPERLARMLMLLNAWEARPGDMVPHYGAWCPGRVNNPAYTSFYPRRLWHPGFVQVLLAWMVARARLADGFLLARGVVPGMNGVEGDRHAAA